MSIPDSVTALAQARMDARVAKDFALADKFRDELLQAGFEVVDVASKNTKAFKEAQLDNPKTCITRKDKEAGDRMADAFNRNDGPYKAPAEAYFSGINSFVESGPTPIEFLTNAHHFSLVSTFYYYISDYHSRWQFHRYRWSRSNHYMGEFKCAFQ